MLFKVIEKLLLKKNTSEKGMKLMAVKFKAGAEYLTKMEQLVFMSSKKRRYEKREHKKSSLGRKVVKIQGKM
jgi:hypothetical protein